ncbi:PBSX family phage terminase large subunit [Natronorubrum halophilum]|uniref:PBSX family phage terminase large subunit n=1 Tax=Natronorubrum halophilum TaxID=1702106 RepID=UPI0010C21618|nr:terminase large subunit [Natronorubrum halophilum]
MSTTRSTNSYTDEFPEPSYTIFDRQRDSREVRPYVHPDTGLAPQEDFLAGPAGDAAIESDASNHVIISGLGAGKTATLIMRAWANAERWNRGELGAIIAPDWPSIKNAILPTMRDFGLLEVCDYVGPGGEEPGVHTPSGSRIILQTASNERKIRRLRGPNLAWAGIDEPASIAERAYEVLSGRLRVGNYRNLFVTGTPRGFNWVYDRFYEDDADVLHDDVYEVRESDRVRGVFGVPSWLNPHNPDDYIDRLEDDYSGSYYEQEVEGSFTQFDGLVYPWFDRSDHIIDAGDLPDSWDETVYGVDWGFSSHAGIIAIRVHGDRWYVAEERKSRRMGNDDIAAELESMEEDHGSGPVYCDSAEPKSIAELEKAGFDARKSDKSVEEGIKTVAAKRDELRVADVCQETINEFNAYQYKDGSASEKPVKENDHIMDALRYAIFTHETEPEATIHYKSGSMPSQNSIR